MTNNKFIKIPLNDKNELRLDSASFSVLGMDFHDVNVKIDNGLINVVEEYDASQEETQHIFALRKEFLSDSSAFYLPWQYLGESRKN